MGWGEALGALVQGVGQFASGLFGFNANRETNASQEAINQKQIDLQREAWAREDNAVQRRMKDLEAAGLSPTLAAGSAAAASSPSVHLKASQSGLDKLGAGIAGASQAINTYYALKTAKAEAKVAESNAKIADVDAENKEMNKILERMSMLERFGILKNQNEAEFYRTGLLKKEYQDRDLQRRIRRALTEKYEDAVKHGRWDEAMKISDHFIDIFMKGASLNNTKNNPYLMTNYNNQGEKR